MKVTSGSLRIKDSSATDSEEGTGRIEFTKADENSTLEVTGSGTGLHLEGGTLNSAKSTAVRITEGAVVTVTGGTVSGSVCGIYVGSSGEGAGGVAGIGGGTISGAQYGIYLSKGTVLASEGSTAFVSSDNKSVGMEAGQSFYILGGTYSDAEGNEEGYSRSDGKILVKGADAGHPERYALGNAVAKRTVNEKDIFYASLHAAVNDASNIVENITLLADTTDHFAHSKKGSDIILDLNEKTLTVDENEGVSAANNANLVIINGTIKAGPDVETVISASGLAYLTMGGDSVRTITIDAAGSYLTAYDGAELEINGATVNGEIKAEGEKSTVSILSGTINGEIYKEGETSNFLINAGKFKTDTGNGKDFTRPDNKYLADKDGDGWYELEDVDKSALEEAISKAKEEEKGVAVSTDGKDVDPADKWTNADEKKALDDAIAAAQKVADSKTATQKEVDDAAAKVKEATDAYNKAKKAGTKPAPEPKPTPTPTPTPEPTPTPDRKDQKGEDGTAFGKGASLEAAEAALASMTSDGDPAGTKFAPLYAQSKKVTKKSAKVTWKKVSGATKYVVYGNRCGKKYKFKKIKEVSGKSLNVKKVAGKKLKKKTNYKFLVVAVDADNNIVSTSKVVHVITKGGKYKNYTKVKVTAPKAAKKGKLSLKAGKSAKIKAKAVGKKVKAHRKLMYESLDTSIATVGAKNGKIKAVKKGTTRITVYASNGVYKQIKVTVK